MLKSQKHIFWEAFLVTVLIFGIGIFIGVVIENLRAGEISNMYLASEINLLDIRVQTQILDLADLNCDEAITKNIEFGDRVYEDAKVLGRYETANKLTDEIVQEHKKYDLLRAMFWANSIKIKEKCGEKFHTVVYLYDYNSDSIEQKSKQAVFSKFLEELKKQYGNDIILIPIARDMGLVSVDLLAKNYGISETSIILDESSIYTKLDDLKLLEEDLKNT